jgi:hypothetical protein
MQQAAEAAGLAFVFNPVTGGMLTEANVEEQAEAIAGSEGPVVAYCASGNRSTVVWALGVAGEVPVDDIIARAAENGYNLTGCARSWRRWRRSAAAEATPRPACGQTAPAFMWGAIFAAPRTRQIPPRPTGAFAPCPPRPGQIGSTVWPTRRSGADLADAPAALAGPHPHHGLALRHLVGRRRAMGGARMPISR